MLCHLRIRDFAIIDSAELALGSGFNVITGETGAGKSLLVTAASLLRGGRMNTDLIRLGAEEAVVEAIFDISARPECAVLLKELGIPCEDDEIIVRRTISRNGRGRVNVNGALSTAAVLARITEDLIEISGQHEYQFLSNGASQRELLDSFAQNGPLVEKVRQIHSELVAQTEALKGLNVDERQRQQRVEFLEFQLEEIKGLALKPGEEAELRQEQQILGRAAELKNAAEQADARLYSDEGAVVDVLASFERQLQDLGRVDSRLVPITAELEQVRITLDDAARELRAYAEGIDLDPDRLVQVEDRMDRLHRLQRKHGCSIDELIARAVEMEAEVDALKSLDDRRAELRAAIDALRQTARGVAIELSKKRASAAARMKKEAQERLADLQMSGASLRFELSALPCRDSDEPELCLEDQGQRRRLGRAGWDRVELLAVTNKGEDFRPVSRIASGGELSRMMLALTQVMGQHDPVSTSIFDEVDAGIGGRVADAVGRSLAAVARQRQVIVVTHLPQVAAYAQTHFHVGKRVSKDKRTVTETTTLSGDDRVEELARMLAASDVTPQARANARQLLRSAAL